MLSINSSMSWFAVPATLDMYPLSSTHNGSVFFYKYVDKSSLHNYIYNNCIIWFNIYFVVSCCIRDMTVLPKQLSTSERMELNVSEKARLDSLGLTSYYSPRRDRPLKIYTADKAAPNLKTNGTTEENATNTTTATVVTKDAPPSTDNENITN